MDAVYRIVRVYGVSLPVPSSEIYPMKWFSSINAQPWVLQEAASKIDFSLYEHPNFEGDSVRFSQITMKKGTLL